MATNRKNFVLDQLGIVVSTICLIHCFLTPILLVSFPLIAALQAYDVFLHVGMAAVMLPVAFRAIQQGYRHHKKIQVPVIAGIGMVIFLGSVAIVLFDHHDHGEPADLHIWDQMELLLSAIGSVMISAGHGLNIWFCRKPR